ncbi:MAG: FUSC family protein, partial [Bacteroidetes bacterium]|nr:FUSC family protein [Bacteroidota bacterium]
VSLIKETPVSGKPEQQKAVNRILQLAERSIKLIESSIERLDIMGEDLPVYRSYSLIKTLFVLHPKYWIKNIGILFNFNTFTTRYALRTGVAAAIGMLVYKWFDIDHGYWLPFSAIIIIQPYFGATFKKAIDRIAGTLLGGLTGGLLLRIHTGLHIKEAILFLTFILMVYYLRKNYAITAFIITINLVLLFNVEAAIDSQLIITRALCTIGGAGLAVIAGFALLPTWDKKWLPKHLAEAVNCNYQYFLSTFFSGKINVNWTRNKRSAESKNSNVFDSFNRYQQEPTGQNRAPLYYELITHNVRITRDLNNIHLEQEQSKTFSTTTMDQQARIQEALQKFNKIIEDIKTVNPDINAQLYNYSADYRPPFLLNDTQMVYLDKLVIELKTMQQDMNSLLDALK